jgi:hypothetical protein
MTEKREYINIIEISYPLALHSDSRIMLNLW